MDQPPYKRPRMGLPPRPQFGLNNPGGWRSSPNFYKTAQPKVGVSNTALIGTAPIAVQDEGRTFSLSNRCYRCVKSKEGKLFRSLLKEKLGVDVRCESWAGARTITLHGSVNLKRAETAIITFCNIRSVKLKKISKVVMPPFYTLFSDEALQCNLRTLSDSTIAWFHYAKCVHDRILEQIDAIKNDCSEKEYHKSIDILMASYKTLNAIVFGKLQYGDGKHHVEIMQRSGGYDRDTVQKSFNYVFNSDRRRFSDYGDALAKLSDGRASEDFIKLELERMRRATEGVCGQSGWLDDNKRIISLYIKLIIGGYQDGDVKEFRNECRQLQIRKRIEGGN